MKPRVLVSTANGRTGAAAIHELLRLGFPVRALVRRDDARARRWRDLGVEVVVGSLFDFRDLRRALNGVQRAYHCPPFDATHLHNSMLFALAAMDAGVEVVALMSGWNPHPSHDALMQREHWMTNNLYRRLEGLDVIHINPGMFAFPYLLGVGAAKHFGMLALPFGEGKNAPPSNEDIGAVAAHALADPGPWIGRCLRPMGPELLAPTDVADVLTRVLGRNVVYRDVPTWAFVKFAVAMGFPTFAVSHVRRYSEELRAGVYGQAPNGLVERVTGRPPESFEATARRYVAEPERIWPGLTVGSFADAVWLAAKAALTPVPDLDAWEAEQSFPTIRKGQLAHENGAWRDAAASDRLVLLGGS